MKRVLELFSLCLAATLFCTATHALEFSSGKDQSAVIELYTSEGCSSCPPAERWVSSFKDHPDLFSRIIPLAFHVDYWNYLGWEDRFADAAFSQRQRDMKRQGLLKGVYTPGVLVSSREWQAWRTIYGNPNGQLPRGKQSVGVLKAELDGQALNIQFENVGSYRVHMALLGMGLSSKVTSGENSRRTLEHDFVVLHHQSQKGTPKETNRWQLTLPSIPKFGQSETAIVVWLSEPSTERIVQAAASMLP